MDVPRDPSFYSPTTHAGQQAKHRNIGWDTVAETIETGDVKPSHKQNCCLFVKEYPTLENAVGVVANYKDGVVITIEFRK
jgi:hypothetical protein